MLRKYFTQLTAKRLQLKGFSKNHLTTKQKFTIFLYNSLNKLKQKIMHQIEDFSCLRICVIISTMKRYLSLFIEVLLWFIFITALVMGTFLYNHIKLKEKHSYHVFFNDTNGIRNGSPVKIMGNEIGYVSNVNVINSDEIFVSFVITKNGISIPAGTMAKVESTGLVGSRSLELYPPQTKTNKEDEILIPVNPERVQGAFENSTRIAEVLYNASSNVNKSLDIGQIPLVRNLVHKSYEQTIDMPKQIEKINEQQTEITSIIKDNENIKNFNEKMENFAK